MTPEQAARFQALFHLYGEGTGSKATTHAGKVRAIRAGMACYPWSRVGTPGEPAQPIYQRGRVILGGQRLGPAVAHI